MRTDSYKYIEYQKDIRQKELFDLKADPKEKKNIINTQRGIKLTKELKEELEKLKRETGYRFFTHG